MLQLAAAALVQDVWLRDQRQAVRCSKQSRAKPHSYRLCGVKQNPKERGKPGAIRGKSRCETPGSQSICIYVQSCEYPSDPRECPVSRMLGRAGSSKYFFEWHLALPSRHLACSLLRHCDVDLSRFERDPFARRRPGVAPFCGLVRRVEIPGAKEPLVRRILLLDAVSCGDHGRVDLVVARERHHERRRAEWQVRVHFRAPGVDRLARTGCISWSVRRRHSFDPPGMGARWRGTRARNSPCHKSSAAPSLRSVPPHPRPQRGRSSCSSK